MSRARGANSVMNLAIRSTGAYGDIPASGYTTVPFVSSELGETQGLVQSDLLGQGREPQAPSLDVANNEGNVVVPVDLNNIGLWLRLLLGDPATSGSTNKTHVFSSGAAALPDAAVEVGFPDVPSYGKNFGVMANTFGVNLARSGNLNATLGLIAQGETRATSSGAGTPAVMALERFNQFTGEILVDGASAGDIVSGSVNYSNNLDKVEVIRPDGRIAGADPGQATVNGQVALRFKDTTLLDKAVAGAPVALSLGWTISATKKLTLLVPRVYLPKPKLPVSGPGGIQATFDYQGAKDPTTGVSFKATLLNAIASY